MKRVLGPDDIDEVTSILVETQSKSFAENIVKDLINEASDAIESTNFSDEHKTSLIDSAKLIVDSN
jgi:geranylgeranyl pyrophosphate synthase